MVFFNGYLLKFNDTIKVHFLIQNPFSLMSRRPVLLSFGIILSSSSSPSSEVFQLIRIGKNKNSFFSRETLVDLQPLNWKRGMTGQSWLSASNTIMFCQSRWCTVTAAIFWQHCVVRWPRANLLHDNWSCCLERFYMGYKGENEHIMHTVFAIS